MVFQQDGSNGQPSLLYQGKIDLNDSKQVVLLELMGHGHYSGKDGIVYPDLTGYTTALEIVKQTVYFINCQKSDFAAILSLTSDFST